MQEGTGQTCRNGRLLPGRCPCTDAISSDLKNVTLSGSEGSLLRYKRPFGRKERSLIREGDMVFLRQVYTSKKGDSMLDKLIYDFTMVWVTIEPISTAVLFATLTSKLTRAEQRKVAWKATLYSAMLLIGSIIGGQILLSAMNIQLISLQVAGGVILFLFAVQMIFGQAAVTFTEQPEAGHDMAVFPLAIPSIVGAETIMVVVLLTDNHLYDPSSQFMTALVVLTVLLATFVMMLLANRIVDFFGKNGAAILERITGMILAALAVELVMQALGISRWLDG